MRSTLVKQLFRTLVIGCSLCSSAALAAEARATFYAPFEDSVDAVAPSDSPKQLLEGKFAYAEGVKGRGVLLNNQQLSYLTKGNFSNARGSLEFWVKLLEVDPKETHSLFYENDMGVAPGEQNLRLLILRDGGLFCNVSDTGGHWFSAGGFSPAESMGSWSHIVLTWDKDKGMRLYVDGRMTMQQATRRPMNFKRDSKEHEKFFLGDAKAKLVLDEVKIYDAMLDEGQVLDKYQALYPLTLASLPGYFEAGVKRQVTLAFVNKTGARVSGDVSYTIIGKDGQTVLRGAAAGLSVEPLGRKEVRFDFQPNTPGDYTLAYSFGRMSRSGALRVAAQAPAAPKPTADADMKLELVKAFDCAKNYGPDEFCDDGSSRVVQSPIGAYRETGEKEFSRFAYRFLVDEIQTSHLAVVEYPDDKDRVMEFMIDQPSGGKHTVENGVITGGEYPNDNKFHEFKLIFYPQDKENAIIFMNWPGAPAGAAGRSVKIYKIAGDLPPLKVANQPPRGKQRLVGSANEDASMIYCEFGVKGASQGLPPTFEQFSEMMRRRVNYMRFTGQNLMAYPLFHYRGALYPSFLLNRAGKLEYHPGPWVDLILSLCEKNSITFVPAVDFINMAELDSAPMDKEALINGADTPYAVTWNGEQGGLLRYDILHPETQKQLLAIVDDIDYLYGGSPAFGGMDFWIWAESSLWLPRLEIGYSDRDIAMFESDTGIKVPCGAAPDPQRFVKRYTFLTQDDPAVREKWTAWRCGKIRVFWVEVLKHLRTCNPDAILNLELAGLEPAYLRAFCRQDHWQPWNPLSVQTFYRKGGVDVELFKNIPGLYLGELLYHNIRPPDDRQFWRDFDFDPATIVPFRNRGQNSAWLFQARRESQNWAHISAVRMPGFWWEDNSGLSDAEKAKSKRAGFLHKSPAIMPHGDFHMEYYAKALADFDSRYIADGGITTTTLGHEDSLRKFIKAYRALPAEDFEIFKEVDDPVCVRAAKLADGYYFYLVNREFYPVEVAMTFNPAGSFELLDLPNDKREQVADGKFKATVGPFGLLAFRAPVEQALGSVAVAVPADKVKWLADKLAGVRAQIQKVRDLKIEDRQLAKEMDWVSGEMDKAWETQRYSRLRHLLFSQYARKAGRVLDDPELRSYLAVPQAYKDKFMDPAFEVKATKTDRLPALADKAWDAQLTTDMFSEVKKIEGVYQPKPATRRTEVVVMFDDKELGLYFRCFDPDVAQVVAKRVDRDGKLSDKDDDSIEIFLSSEKGNLPYYRFAANFGGSRADAIRPAYKGENYNPEWTIETVKRDGRWDMLVKIPFEALGKTPRPGDVWGLNLGRSLRGQDLCLRCGPKTGFHCPELFARLKF